MSVRSTVVPVALAALAVAGCGKDDPKGAAAGKGAQVAQVAPSGALPTTTPGAVSPGTQATTATPAPAKPKAVPTALDDAEAADAFATSRADLADAKAAPSPGAAKVAAAKVSSASDDAASVSPGAPSDAEIARELKQMDAVMKARGGTGHGIQLEPDGTAKVAPNVPLSVARIVAGANAIAKYPYVYGGGHGSFEDNAYDCSGSVSYALAAAGLLKAPITSGQLADTGKKGPGKWITIYANAGHTFMYVDGLRYDTSGRGGPLGTRWSNNPRSLAGFTITHPPGL